MQKKSVLIFDDEADICEICHLVLGSDYNVETFKTIENLFIEIERVKPNIILMDLMMAKINDGERAIEILLKNNATKEIPLIVFSAFAHGETISKRLGATAFIEKPFNIADLRETVARHIK